MSLKIAITSISILMLTSVTLAEEYIVSKPGVATKPDMLLSRLSSNTLFSEFDVSKKILVASGASGIGSCGAYCHDIEPTRRKSCSSDSRPHYDSGRCTCVRDPACK
ncbi:exported hypothetical protein [Candidatus Competibacter denitrificans Run_A_D11]|uniref:Uncharacterized protein n=1 Tax=Candidatus Competibacter denitrificans Run_A_D11 TaxID=1400863 RepID=W6MEH9_9GAMM|nr:exported hypothetical protein [Candidatus Competibacter denitrificans Run_A_D11]